METFKPDLAQSRGLWQAIVEPLRRSIVLGELPPGLHLGELVLAQKFGVSRIPVRQALSRLAHEGLIRVEPRRGAFVVGLTDDEISHIYEYRALIESYAIRRAAVRVDAAGLDMLRSLADRMEAAARRDEPLLFAQADAELHRAVVALAGNPHLTAAWESIEGMVATILGITDPNHPDIRQAISAHRAMIDALAHGDADRAEQLIREHLAFGERVMRSALHANGRARSSLPAAANG